MLSHQCISIPVTQAFEGMNLPPYKEVGRSTRIILHHAHIRKPLSVATFGTSFFRRRTNQLPFVVPAVDPSRPLSSLHKQEPAPMRFSRSYCVVSQSFEVMAAQYPKDRRKWGQMKPSILARLNQCQDDLGTIWARPPGLRLSKRRRSLRQSVPTWQLALIRFIR